jgi:hypothetical protein
VSNGAPVALKYYAMSYFVVPLHVYEMYRQPRSRESFLLPGSALATSLAKNGFSREEMCARDRMQTEIERRLAADEMKLAQSSQTSSLVGLKFYGLKKTKVLRV